jgi:hypothetical protein
MSKVISVLMLGVLLAGGFFLATHHSVTNKDSCYWSADADAEMCDFTWERNK